MSERKKGLVPRLRFPEFREAGEWISQDMGDLYCFQSTNTLSRDKLNYVQGYVRNIHYGDIHTKFATWFDVTQEQVPFINVSESTERVKPESYCRPGDIVLADASEDLEDVGKSIEIINTDNEKIVAGLHTILARPVNDAIIVGFGGYLFKSGIIRDQIKNEAQGTKVLGISVGRLSRIKVYIPSERTEQKRIADCLSSLDALMAAQADKLDALKTHKQGLMQQLFPREGETVPRLRFPEFPEAGEWEVKKAGLLFSNRIENGEDGLPIYSVTMNDGLAKRDSLDRKIDDIALSSGNKKVHKHDIAYNMMRMWQGACGIAVEDCMVSPAYVVLAPTDAVGAEFYGYFLKLPQALELLTAHSQGLTKDRLRLYYKDFAQIPLPKPSLAEQEKVAACLSSLDALIAAQADKLEALKVHKQGLMQQLFPSPEAVAA